MNYEKKSRSKFNQTNNESIEQLKKMLEYAENLDFERAAEIRDKIVKIERKELGIK